MLRISESWLVISLMVWRCDLNMSSQRKITAQTVSCTKTKNLNPLIDTTRIVFEFKIIIKREKELRYSQSVSYIIHISYVFCIWAHHPFLDETSTFLNLKKGDLVYLEDGSGENVMTNGWCRGYCERTREHGDFPSECVYVLPTLDKPQRDVLVSATTSFFVFIFSCSQILMFSHSHVVMFSYSHVLKFSCSQILMFSNSHVLTFSCSHILMFSCSHIPVSYTHLTLPTICSV